jgi:hypothetical protein
LGHLKATSISKSDNLHRPTSVNGIGFVSDGWHKHVLEKPIQRHKKERREINLKKKKNTHTKPLTPKTKNQKRPMKKTNNKKMK